MLFSHIKMKIRGRAFSISTQRKFLKAVICPPSGYYFALDGRFLTISRAVFQTKSRQNAQKYPYQTGYVHTYFLLLHKKQTSFLSVPQIEQLGKLTMTFNIEIVYISASMVTLPDL